METLRDIGEHEVINRLLQQLGTHRDLAVGAGDDCAVCRLPGTGTDQVLTTDPVIENVHFLQSDDPGRIGNKAAGRVLSDMAAMGAQPQWLLVNVVAPNDLEFQVLLDIYVGMNNLCKRFGATIIGGDLSKGACLELHVFGTGVLPTDSALLRSGAHPGDAIFVTGALGKSGAGKHLDFIPRVEEGIYLRQSGVVTAMMDISDGLATDLRHMLKQSGVGAELDTGSIPKFGTVEQALYDGEDFELLFTVSPDCIDALCKGWKERFGSELFRIGRIDNETEVLKIRSSGGEIRGLECKAFEHFSNLQEPE
jgi:thiamine-monophosphate kinase